MNKNENVDGFLGCITAQFYKTLSPVKSFPLWDKDYPGWDKYGKRVYYVAYKVPNRNMTKQEFADYFEMPLENVTDKLYEGNTTEHSVMVMPEDAFTPHERLLYGYNLQYEGDESLVMAMLCRKYGMSYEEWEKFYGKESE